MWAKNLDFSHILFNSEYSINSLVAIFRQTRVGFVERDTAGKDRLLLRDPRHLNIHSQSILRRPQFCLHMLVQPIIKVNAISSAASFSNACQMLVLSEAQIDPA